MSFFNDDEGPQQPTSPRAPRKTRSASPRPRRPQTARTHDAADRHAVMARRRIAAGIGVVLLIVIVLAIDSAVKGSPSSALAEYKRGVDRLGHESEHDSKSFFAALANATGKEQIGVENKLNDARAAAEDLARHAEALSVPGAMVEAQRNVLLALDLRSEGVKKIAGLVRTAVGGKAESVSAEIAGDMQIFLASDVIWSQRVAPLGDEALRGAGADSQSIEASRFLPDRGWLEPTTVLARVSGSGVAESGTLAPGTHGDALIGVSAGGTALEAEPAVNHVSGGANPTFTVSVEDSGENTETGVKVEVAVTSGGKKVSGSRTIDKIEAGKTVNLDVPVTGVTLSTASKIEAKVAKVPGEENLENNQASYLATFE